MKRELSQVRRRAAADCGVRSPYCCQTVKLAARFRVERINMRIATAHIDAVHDGGGRQTDLVVACRILTGLELPTSGRWPRRHFEVAAPAADNITPLAYARGVHRVAQRESVQRRSPRRRRTHCRHRCRVDLPSATTGDKARSRRRVSSGWTVTMQALRFETTLVFRREDHFGCPVADRGRRASRRKTKMSVAAIAGVERSAREVNLQRSMPVSRSSANRRSRPCRPVSGEHG